MANEKSKKTKSEQKPLPETKAAPIEHRPVVMNTASESAQTKERAPSGIDKAVQVGKLIEQANEFATGLRDEGAQFALLELSERIKDVPIDEQGLEDVAAHVREMIADLQARVVERLDQSKLSETERKRLANQGVIIIDQLNISPEKMTELQDELRRNPPVLTAGMPTAVPLPAHVTERIEAISEEKMAVERLRLLAVGGETLVQTVERLEKEALRADAASDELEGLRALVGGDLKVRAVGVIVEDAPKEGNPDLYRVHVLERGGGELRVWPLQKGEEMPWHAARHEVERLVETRLTPEDRR